LVPRLNFQENTMAVKPKTMLHVSPDPQPSVFDSIVAVDAGVEHVLQYANVTPQQIQDIVHGAIFTRGVDDLKSTALFIGGNDVDAAGALFDEAKKCFLGSLRVSLMADPNGCNTTAAATVRTLVKHIDLAGKNVTILGATGPVGTRIARLIARSSTSEDSPQINLCSRDFAKAKKACDGLSKMIPHGKFIPYQQGRSGNSDSPTCNADIIISAGAAGIQLMDSDWQKLEKLQVVIDLNAVPPAGILGIHPTDDSKIFDGKVCYGAVGIGNLKMKIHRHAVVRLFQTNESAFEAEEIFAISENI
jgi:hypothetical protein